MRPSYRCCLLLLLLQLGSGHGALPAVVGGDVVDENNEVDGQPPVPLTLPEVVNLLQQGHHQDPVKSTPHQTHREDHLEEDPRFIGITDGGVYRGDLVVYLPITVLLPTFAFRSRYSLAGRRTSDWLSFLMDVGKTMGRSYHYADNNIDDEDIRGPVDRMILQDQVKYDSTLPEYQKDLNFGPLLSRMDAYFTYLRVQDDGCRKRAICQLARDPETFAPLSQLVLSVLRKSEGFSRPATYEPSVFRFKSYYWAAERGADSNAGDCGLLYDKCPADLRDILNMRVIGFWQKLASLVNIKLADE